MRYMGSKNRLSKEISPIIQSYINENTKGYFEPFVGGCNMIDKIDCNNKIGNDSHSELIDLFKYIQIKENIEKLPTVISFEHYSDVRTHRTKKYPSWYVGLVGFCSSYGGRYFDGGYGRRSKDEPDGKYTTDGINNLIKQAPLLENIKFINYNFLDIPKEKIKGYVIYCDPPYKGTKQYSTSKFPTEQYYQWCIDLSKDNIVICSEYEMPRDRFKCIWEKEHKTMIDYNANKKDTKRIERLFICK